MKEKSIWSEFCNTIETWLKYATKQKVPFPARARVVVAIGEYYRDLMNKEIDANKNGVMKA
jgi:hypothetical protein